MFWLKLEANEAWSLTLWNLLFIRGNIFVNNHSDRGLENVVSVMKRRYRKLCVHITLRTAFGEGAS